MAQLKQAEWHEQWTMFEDSERFLFQDWIHPMTLEGFRDKEVLECGCGGGQHTAMLAPIARSVLAVDLNTSDIARERNRRFSNVTFLEADLAEMDLGRQFDVVMCIGVIHHTSDPDRTFANIFRHCRVGGAVVIWTYSAEGNALMRYVVEPCRKLFLSWWPRRGVVLLSRILTACLYPIVHTVYRASALSFLPYHAYFSNFRRLSFQRNVLNVFDKLNAPQTRFTTHEKCQEWFTPRRFEPATLSITPYVGVSWRLYGVRRGE